MRIAMFLLAVIISIQCAAQEVIGSADARYRGDNVVVRITLQDSRVAFDGQILNNLCLYLSKDMASKLSSEWVTATIYREAIGSGDYCADIAYKVKPASSRANPPGTRPLQDESGEAIGRVAEGTDCETEAITVPWSPLPRYYTTNAEGIRGLTICESN